MGGDKILGYKELDPINLEAFLDDDKKKKWKFSSGGNEIIMDDKKILYLSTISPNGFEMSFGESLYKRLISSRDEKFIEKHTDFYVNKLSKK